MVGVEILNLSKRFGKVSKQWFCLDTFSIHPWTVVTFDELVPQIIEWLEKLVQERICGSQQLMPDRRKRLKPYTLNHWVVGSIPTRCMPYYQRVTEKLLGRLSRILAIFKSSFVLDDGPYALADTWDGKTSYNSLLPGAAADFNELTFSYAQRFVFASQDSEQLLRRAVELVGTGPRVQVHRVSRDGKAAFWTEYS